MGPGAWVVELRPEMGESVLESLMEMMKTVTFQKPVVNGGIVSSQYIVDSLMWNS